MVLRVLCILPAFIGGYQHITFSPTVSSNDDYSGLFENKSTPLLHKVALFWVTNQLRDLFSQVIHIISSVHLQDTGVGY